MTPDKIPPFFIGQEVVAIIDHSQGIFKKGDSFIVYGLNEGCCGYTVDIGIKRASEYTRCGICNNRYLYSGLNRVFHHSSFSPKQKFKAISYTKIMEEELVCEN